MVNGFYPKTIKEALMVKKEHPEALLISGGTDVMVVKKNADDIIFLNNIAEAKVVAEKEDCISIGAGCCYTDLIDFSIVPEVLKKAMRNIASPAIRSAGTLAGNICNASPAGDTLPILYATDAIVVLSSLQAERIVERRVGIKDFILGIRKIDLKAEEILVAVEIPKKNYDAYTKVSYEKVGARKSEAISKLSFIGMYNLKNNLITDIRIAFGSVGVTALRFERIEEKLLGKSLKEVEEMKKEIIEEYMSYIHPIDDQRSTAEYRCQICRNLLKEFLSA